MKTKTLLLFMLCASFNASSQNIIRIRPQHHKELIYTLRTNETIINKESKIEMELEGTNYMFKTAYNSNAYKHTRNARRKITNGGGINNFKSWVVENKENLFYIKHKRNGVKYGPFTGAYLSYDYSKVKITDFSISTTGELFGALAYKNKEPNNQNRVKEYFVINPGKWQRGPYKSASIYKANGTDFVYTFNTDEGSYLSRNGEEKGPYSQIIYNKNYTNEFNEEKEIFFYRIGDVWYKDGLEGYSFNERPYVYQRASRTVVFGNVIEKGGIGHFINADGTLTEESIDNFERLNSFKDKLIFKKFELADITNKSNAYTVFYGDSLIGQFYLGGSHLRRTNYFQTDFFSQSLVKIDSTKSLDQYFFSPTKGLVGPYSRDETRQLYAVKNDLIQFRLKDSTLLVNSIITHKNVLNISYQFYPDSWWMVKKEGDYHQPYKNGKKSKKKGIPTRLSYFLNYPENEYITIKKEDKNYIRPKNTNRLLGPVALRSEIAIAKDKRNFAECTRNGNIILINNRVVSEGFNIVYNDELNAFHWFSLSKKGQIHLHTYELD